MSDLPSNRLHSPSLTSSTVSHRLHSILTTTSTNTANANTTTPPLHAFPSFHSHHSSQFARPSRSLSLALSHSSTGGPGSSERAIIALARRPNDAQSRHVAVAGKTYLKILNVPAKQKRAAASTVNVWDDDAVLGGGGSGGMGGATLAARRSRARNSREQQSSSSTNTIGSGGGIEESGGVEEIMDVRSGARLGPSYLFSDVKWGYGATSNKLATSLSNGAVILWDLDQQSLPTSNDSSPATSSAEPPTSKVDQIKYEHDRAVNAIIFGGAGGSWIMSGGQDGLLKLWDIRSPTKPASLILRASSPVLRLAFSPSSAQPFSLLATCASGTMIRYDIRYTGRGGGGATDRIAGHVGACMAMDWRDALDGDYSASHSSEFSSIDDSTGSTTLERKEGGYVATAGMDGTIKIWDFSLPSLSVKPLRTLRTGRPVKDVRWSVDGRRLVACALPNLSLGRRESSEEDCGQQQQETDDEVGEGSAKGRGLGARLDRKLSYDIVPSGGSDWRNEIEIWDVARESFPQRCIKTSQPTSAVLFNDDDTIWSTSSTSATFRQHDLHTDTYAMLETFPRPAAVWNVHGEMAFVDELPRLRNTSMSEPTPVLTCPPVRPVSFLASLPSFDPSHDSSTFALLAHEYILGGRPFGEMCQRNSEVARAVGRVGVAQLWELVAEWLGDEDDPVVDEEGQGEDHDALEEGKDPVDEKTDDADLLNDENPFLLSPLRSVLSLTSQTLPSDVYNNNDVSPRSSKRSSEQANPRYPRTVRPQRSHSNPLAASSALLISPLGPLSPVSTASPSLTILPPLPASTSTPSSIEFARNPASLNRSGSGTRLLRGSGGVGGAHSGAILSSLPPLASGSAPMGNANASGSVMYGIGLGAVGRKSSLTRQMRKGDRGTKGDQKLKGKGKGVWSESDDDDDEDSDDEEREINDAKAAGGEVEVEEDADDVISHSNPHSLPNLSRSVSLSSRRFSLTPHLRHSSMTSNDAFHASSTTTITRRRRSTFSHQVHAQALAEERERRARTASFENNLVPPPMPPLPLLFRTERSESALGMSGMIEAMKEVGAERQEKRRATKERAEEKRRLRLVAQEENSKRVDEMRERVREVVRKTLEEYAESGDNQLCAVVCCVLQDRGMNFHPMFVARLSKAYLDLLRRAQLHTASAALIKYSSTELFKTQAQQNIVFHTSCQCGKTIEQPPYDFCRRCKASSTECIICHLVIRSLLTICTKCNHLAHPACLVSYASAFSPLSPQPHSGLSPATRPLSMQLQNNHSNSFPSTPGLPPVIRAWMWGDEEGGGDCDDDQMAVDNRRVDEGEITREEEVKRYIVGNCPKGGCGCSGCSLAVVRM